MSVKYYLSYLFNGDEKAQQYIDLGYILPIDLKYRAKIPAFKNIKNDKNFELFLQRNNTSIKKKLYEHYLNYYSQIPENELQKCCPSDYKQYKALKSKGFTKNITTDDLGMYLDYSKLIIDIVINGQKYVIVFDKRKKIISESNSKLLLNSILKELYERKVVTVENDSVKVVLPFDVHGADCGVPDCYTTTVRFAFPIHNKVVLPKSLVFEEEETGCVEPYRLTDVFQLQE